MAKVHCQEKHNHWLSKPPAMIAIGENGLGKEFICCVCRTKRIFNTAEILTVNYPERYGFIKGGKDNFYFHFSDLAWNFRPEIEIAVSFEIVFLGGGKHKFKAIDIKPSKEKSHAN